MRKSLTSLVLLSVACFFLLLGIWDITRYGSWGKTASWKWQCFALLWPG